VAGSGPETLPEAEEEQSMKACLQKPQQVEKVEGVHPVQQAYPTE